MLRRSRLAARGQNHGGYNENCCGEVTTGHGAISDAGGIVFLAGSNCLTT